MERVHKKKHQRVFLLRLFGSVVAFCVVVFLVWQNWPGVIDALRSLPADGLLLVLLLAFVSRLMVTMRWFVLLKVVEPEVSFWKVLRLSLVGLFSTNVLPSTIGGDMVKLGGAIQSGFDSAGVAASLVIDHLVGMATMATFLPLGLHRLLYISEVTSIQLASAYPIFLVKLWQKVTGFLKKILHESIAWYKQPLYLLVAAFFSYIHMACTFTMVVLILESLGDPISWWTAGGLWVLVYFITLIPISINGLGLQEASLSLIYVTFAGITEANSLVLALLIRLAFMFASLPGAFFLPGVLSESRQIAHQNMTEATLDE